MERRRAPVSRRAQETRHVALYRIGRADVFGVAHRLLLCARLERSMADALPLFLWHYFFDGDDLVPALFELDDGDGRRGIGATRQKEDQALALPDDSRRRHVSRPA